MKTQHPWLGDVGQDFRVGRLKYGLASMTAGGTPDTDNESYWSDDGLPWVAISDMSGTDFVCDTQKCVTSAGISDKRLRTLEPGSLLYSMYASLGQVAELQVPAVTNQAILGLQFHSSEIYGRYAFWQLKAIQPYVVEFASSNTQNNLNAEKVGNLPFMFPPLGMQQRIANFLDEQTARIDALLAAKEELLGKLVEYRVAIAEAVVADIAGELRVKLGLHVDLLPGYAFASDDFSDDPNDVPLLRGINVAPGCIRWDEAVYWPHVDDATLERFRLKAGDVVFGMDRPWVNAGTRVAMIDKDSENAFLLQRVCRLRGGSKFHQRFIYYALASDGFRQSVEVDLTGVSVPHISPEQILSFKVPAISFEEQVDRCEKADTKASAIDELAVHASQVIDRLREYRSSLISAAVTGQIDISNFQLEAA